MYFVPRNRATISLTAQSRSLYGKWRKIVWEISRVCNTSRSGNSECTMGGEDKSDTGDNVSMLNWRKVEARSFRSSCRKECKIVEYKSSKEQARLSSPRQYPSSAVLFRDQKSYLVCIPLSSVLKLELLPAREFSSPSSRKSQFIPGVTGPSVIKRLTGERSPAGR